MTKSITLFIIMQALMISGCAEKTFTTTVIMFDSVKRESTNKDKIIVFHARLDIHKKFVEFGTIKYEDVLNEDIIKEIAAKKESRQH